MPSARSLTFVVVAAAVALTLAVWAGAAIPLNPTGPSVARNTLPTDLHGKPAALSKHLERLHQTIPGDGGESRGPGGPAAEKIMQLAYPDVDIPAARAAAALAAYNQVQQKGFPRGKGRPGTWVTVGPTNAEYPFFYARDTTVYVPNRYFASGRTTSIAIAPNCDQQSCRVWIGAAGGGIWRTDRALAGEPQWRFLSWPFAMNTIGSIALDPNDPSGNTLWVGTGEGNASADSVFGVGLYRSTDGGDTWQGPFGNSVFQSRAVPTVAVAPGDPNTIYAGSTRAVNGFSSVTGGAITINVPGAAIWGLYKSTDGGANWTLIHNGAVSVVGCEDPTAVANGFTPCSPRGVRRVDVDPVDSDVVYASSYGRGIWRSNDGGATWAQLRPGVSTSSVARSDFDLTVLPNGDTRMYVGEGAQGSPPSVVVRSDSVRTGAPAFSVLSSASLTDPRYGSFNYCTGQCWYDSFVYTPDGHPDIVYAGGSNQYGETGGGNWVSNGRGVVLSTDAGASWTDMTYDGTDFLHPNGLHPDHHAMVTNPQNPYQFFEAGDGGVVRSSGELEDISWQCGLRGITGDQLTACLQLLSAVPTELDGINRGLTTLQFQSAGANPHKSGDIQGGTQDNGTWESYGNPIKWTGTMIGDGGQSGFDVSNPNVRFHTFFYAQADINYSKGDVADWNWISDSFFFPPAEVSSGSFYPPFIHDPVVGETLFAGLLHVWRTQTNGRGTMTIEELRQHCNEWTGDFTVICGDWSPLGDPSSAGSLTSTTYGADRTGGFVSRVERAPSNSSTLWAATSTGRVFVSANADDPVATNVAFTRIDSLASADPGRYVTGLFPDPSDANHAWITYSGFSSATPSQPGHVFSVQYDPGTATASWTSLDGALGDIPLSDVAFDTATGDLYVSSDFAVFRDAAGGGYDWTLAAPGMPAVTVSGLDIVASDRILYAATHGLSVWRLNLP